MHYHRKYNRKVCEDRYADIARMLKLEGTTDSELTDSLIKMIDEFNTKLNIPHSMKEYGIEEADFKANVKFVAHNAILDACTGSSPREIDDATMEKLFECTYYGTDVNF